MGVGILMTVTSFLYSLFLSSTNKQKTDGSHSILLEELPMARSASYHVQLLLIQYKILSHTVTNERSLKIRGVSLILMVL
jgi:hypothetical protein